MAYSFSEFEQKTAKQLAFAKQQFAQLRTGKASVQLLDPVMVEAYGTHMRLQEVANVSVVDAQLLHVAPWDRSLLGAVEKGIASAGLNLNPVVDQDTIRVPVPALTEERRKEMVKSLHKEHEEVKAGLRVLRSEYKKEIEAQEGTDGISEDDIKADLEELENKVKTTLTELEAMVAAKEKELMTI